MTDLRAHLVARDYAASSVFRPENMLREARRQKGLPATPVPDICVLDPDGDMVSHLKRGGRTSRHPGWACYHTDLETFDLDGRSVGVIGRAVGSPFAVLVAEQLFASGCQFLVSVTSAGRIGELPPHSCFMLIERALRDEGTSLHYLPADVPAAADPGLVEAIWPAVAAGALRGATWTTDAPFRETEQAIVAARAEGALAVEMEAAALYAFARARRVAVLCFAHVTNAMGQAEGDFEKGEADGAVAALDLVAAAARAWAALPP